MSDLVVRDFAPADLDAVLELRARVFGRDDLTRERERWRWEFERNPFRDPRQPCSWVLEKQGRLIGNYGLLPAQVAVDGERRSALCGMDFCIDPTEQGAGQGLLFTRRFLDPGLCDFPFVTSPTPAATAMTRYFGAEVLAGREEPCLWVRSGSAGEPAAPEPSVQVRRIDGFDERFDELFDELCRHHRLWSVRDRVALNWRYRDYPFGSTEMVSANGAGGELRGFAVLQEEEALHRHHAAELCALPDDEPALRALVRELARSARARGSEELYVLQRVPAVQEVLREEGFHAVEGHPLTFLCRLPAGLSLCDWYLSAGDGDLLYDVGTWPP